MFTPYVGIYGGQHRVTDLNTQRQIKYSSMDQPNFVFTPQISYQIITYKNGGGKQQDCQGIRVESRRHSVDMHIHLRKRNTDACFI